MTCPTGRPVASAPAHLTRAAGLVTSAGTRAQGRAGSGGRRSPASSPAGSGGGRPPGRSRRRIAGAIAAHLQRPPQRADKADGPTGAATRAHSPARIQPRPRPDRRNSMADHVLVIEDDPRLGTVLLRFLSREGYTPALVT